MADRIEIDNVGGRDGVASEATMQLLLMEFRAKAGTDSRYQKLAERATNLNTQAQNKNTKETNLATKAIKGLAGSAKGFAKEAVLGGDRQETLLRQFLDQAVCLQNLFVLETTQLIH